MREIKFRAWNGERMRAVWSIGWIDGEMDFITTPKFSEPAEDCVLMQYTEMKDNKGVEIYEDDIVIVEIAIDSYREYFTGQVKMNEGRWWVDNGRNAIPLWSEMREVAILGNIHENPELLKEQVTK